MMLRFTAAAGELADALSLVALALDQKAIPALCCAHVRAAAGRIEISLSALDHFIHVTAKAAVEHEGSTAVRASSLARLVAATARDVDVTIEANNVGAVIRCGRSNYRLAVIPVDDLAPTSKINSQD